jgi:hypothetical protein
MPDIKVQNVRHWGGAEIYANLIASSQLPPASSIGPKEARGASITHFAKVLAF